MTNFGWSYPPGVSSIPGDHDIDISFTVSFPYTFEKFEDEQPIETMKFNLNIKDYTIDLIEKNPDETYTAWITYEDNLCIDRCMDEDEIENAIRHYMWDDYAIELNKRNPNIEISWK